MNVACHSLGSNIITGPKKEINLLLPNLVMINNILANKININNKYSVLIGSLVSALTPDGGRFAQI
jgi:hypothetical protein